MIIDPKSFYTFYTKTCEEHSFKIESYEDFLDILSTMFSKTIEALWKNNGKVGSMGFNFNEGPYITISFISKNKP
jgi:hypothetical protein